MKNLTVIHSFPTWLPQTQTWMHTQVSELQRLGIDTHVVCERSENSDQFTVDNIHCLSDEGRLKQCWDKAMRKLKLRRHLSYLVEVGSEIGVNIVHSHFGNVGWANLGAVRKLGAKHVVTFYGFDVNKLPAQYPVWRARYYQLFEEADLFLCEGSHMARCLIDLGCPESKVRVQHIGVDIDFFDFKPRTWSKSEPLKILIAASFREKKGIPYAIEALGVLCKELPVMLTIIGDATNDPLFQQEKNKILNLIQETGLMDKTRRLGYQRHSVMMKEAYDHHLFLHPSVTALDGDTEGGAPVGIIEMLATGMPVVSTMHCDIPEVMFPEKARFLARERNVDDIVQILRAITLNWTELGEPMLKLREHVEHNYNLRKQTLHLVDVYSMLLSAPRSM